MYIFPWMLRTLLERTKTGLTFSPCHTIGIARMGLEYDRHHTSICVMLAQCSNRIGLLVYFKKNALKGKKKPAG